MKRALGGLIRSLDTAKERISELEKMSIETSQTEIQRKNIIRTNNDKEKNDMPEPWGQLQRNGTCSVDTGEKRG